MRIEKLKSLLFYGGITEEDEQSVKRRLAELERLAAGWKGELSSGISMAYGMASERDAGDTEGIMKAADARMYEAKRVHYSNEDYDRRKT